MYNALMSAWLFIWVGSLLITILFFTYYVLCKRLIKKKMVVIVEGETKIPCNCNGCNTIRKVVITPKKLKRKSKSKKSKKLG